MNLPAFMRQRPPNKRDGKRMLPMELQVAEKQEVIDARRKRAIEARKHYHRRTLKNARGSYLRYFAFRGESGNPLENIKDPLPKISRHTAVTIHDPQGRLVMTAFDVMDAMLWRDSLNTYVSKGFHVFK